MPQSNLLIPNKVTVIIVNWNGEAFLARCLVALSTQTLKPHEIILIDNASSDYSLHIVRQFPSVKLISHSENEGFARGNNIALSSVQTEWVALINPDAFADPHWLEQLLIAANNNPEFDFFSSKLLNALDASILDGEGDAYHISGRVRRLGRGLPTVAGKVVCEEVFSPCAAAALYRSKILFEVGGFDEEYFCYVEDVDLGFRLRLAGYRCLYVPDSVAHHIGCGTTGGSRSNFSLYHGHRNLVWTFVKNMPGILFWTLLPLHILMNLASVAWFTQQGHGEVILRAKRDALKGLPRMWRKRQLIQRNRATSIFKIWKVLSKQMCISKANRNKE